MAYLIGAIPTSVLASKLTAAPDVRYAGSKHAGATNLMRLAGPRIGAVVVIVDGLKGLIAWAIAYIITLGSPYALPLAAVMAVIGHCWPIYTRFHGGMGLATAGGLMFVVVPQAIAVALPIWAILYLGVFKKKYSARCVTIAIPVGVLLSVLFLGLADNINLMLILLAPVLVIKHLPDWNRVE